MTRGRPRRRSVDSAILDAALGVMVQRGYRGMTVEAVAAAAGVSEPTVYLRHRNKHQLALAAIGHGPVVEAPPDTGHLRDDLTEFLADLSLKNGRLPISLAAVALVEEHEHPELLARWRATVGAALGDAVCTMLRRGRRRGDISPDLSVGPDPRTVVELCHGAYVSHYLVEGLPSRLWAQRTSEVLWNVLAQGEWSVHDR